MPSPNSLFRSYSVLQNISLPSYTPPPVDDIEKENNPFFSYETKGGILSDTKYIWNSNGSLFTLYNTDSGAKISAWNFGAIIKSPTTVVSCVTELLGNAGKLPLLIIGLQCASQGQICVFNISTSTVLRCIEIDERVISLSVVDAEYGLSSFSKYLRDFDGVVAVGTSGGNVYLVDINRLLCEEVLDSEVRDEINPCQLEIVTPDNYLLERSFTNNTHLTILLNGEDDEGDRFSLKGPKGNVIIYVNKEELEVSALHYCPQLGSLLVGFNFGAWQLWDLTSMKLIYTSPVYQEHIPVSHFGVQEPCDDPRAFCYIWAVYSHTEPDRPGYSLAVLYSLNYESKESVEGYGTLYKNLTTCSVRFQMDVTNCQRELGKVDTPIRAQCIKLQTIYKTIPRNCFGDTQYETVAVCSIVWNVWNAGSPRSCKTYLSLFDLNQWYKEQMPGSSFTKDSETYLNCACLSNILTNNDKQLRMLDALVNTDTVNQFMGSQRLEEHYFPSSLAFQMIALHENFISIIDNQGNQKALITSLESWGPSALLKPTEAFFLAINSGLTPLFIDVPNKTSATIEFQRELLLSVALEQKLLGWLCKCVSTWSSGVYENSGCNLNFLLSWGWQRALVLKENADKLSVILFDYSGSRLDANTHNLLSHCSRQLKDISTIFKFIVRKFLGFVLNPDTVRDQCESLEMAATHLEVVDWLLNIGLLPECPENVCPRIDEFGRINAPYPINTLNKYYDDRAGKESLFIDNLIKNEFGECNLQEQWSAVTHCARYPPQSLQALMRTYLVENVSLLHKHCVVAYLLLDVSSALDHNQYRSTKTHLLKFPAIFHLSPSLTKIIQSFWQLDHGDFQDAVENLLDPTISANDLQLWHHRVVLKTLLSYKQHNLAFSYLRMRQPAVTEVNDLCVILSLYVANNMIDEGFHFQRQNQNVDVSSTLLHHFYKECDKVNNLKSVLFLPLSKEEEDMFISYLTEVNHPQANELQIYYYTQRSRYVDAMQIYDKSGTIKAGSRGLEGQHLLSDSDSIIKKLTNVSSQLSRSIVDHLRRNDLNLQKGSNSQPFSVFVHNSEEHIKYKSSMIEAALVKAKETWSEHVNTNSTKKIIQDDVPFISTPRVTAPTPRVLTKLIYPKLSIDDDGPSAKRFKPTSRLSVPITDSIGDQDVTCRKLSVRLDTPVVERKISISMDKRTTSQFSETPQSILKNQTHRHDALSESDDNIESHDAIHSSFINKYTSSASRGSLGLTPRRPLVGSSKHAVRFSFIKTPSESSATSSDADFEIIQESALIHSSLEGKEVEKNNVEADITVESNKSEITEAKESSITNLFEVSNETSRTPRARRSYRELGEVNVRSSPRLQKLKETDAEHISVVVQSPVTSETLPSTKNSKPNPPRASRSRRSYRDAFQNEVESSELDVPKDIPENNDLSKETLSQPRKRLEGRRSLSRRVLENNAFSRIIETTCTSKSSISEDIIKSVQEITIPEDVVETTVKDEVYEEVEMDTSPEEKVIAVNVSTEEEDKDKETSDDIAVPEVSSTEGTKDTSAEGGKNSSDDVDVNIYDLSEDDDYESVDPKLSVFDVSNDLILNESISPVGDHIIETETNSNYIADTGEVFGDKSDVLITVDDTVNESTAVIEGNDEPFSSDAVAEADGSSKHSSASSDVEIIELSSSSDDAENLEPSSSEDEDIYSTENDSSVNPTDSEESSSSSPTYKEYSINSKDIVTESDISKEITESAALNVIAEEEEEVQSNSSEGKIPENQSSSKELGTSADKGEDEAITTVKDKLSSVESSDCKSSVNVIDDDIFYESIISQTPTELNDTFFSTGRTPHNVFVTSTPPGSIKPLMDWDENVSFETDILDKTADSKNERWSSPSDFLSTPKDSQKVFHEASSTDYLDNSAQNNTIADSFEVKYGSPVRRSKRISSLNTPDTSDLRKYTLRKRSLSTSQTSAAIDVSKLKQSLPQVPSKRKRSSSTNTPQRSQRGASVDIELLSEKNKQAQTGKIVHRKSKSAVVSSESKMQTYSSSRRLTRKQANLLKKNLGTDSIELKEAENEVSQHGDNSEHSPSRGPDLAKIDAIDLLDKKSFEGDPDPNEELLVHGSPVSSIAESPIGTRLRSKSSLSNASPVSETSPTPSEGKTKVKRRLDREDGTSKSKSPEQQPVTKTVPRKIRKTRLKSKDTDVSDASTISQAHSVIEPKKPGKITRRTRSATEEIEHPALRRSERNASKSVLPKIVEEPTLMVKQTTSKIKK